MKKNAWPAGAKDYRHRASRRWHCLQLHDCLPNGVPRVFHRQIAAKKIVQVSSRSAACIALLTATIFLDDDADIQPDQRSDIGRQRAVRGCDQNEILTAAQTDNDLLDALIQFAGFFVNITDQCRLLFILNTHNRVKCGVQVLPFPARPCLHGLRLTLSRNRACGAGGTFESGQHQFIGIGKAGLFAAHCTDADTLIQVEAACLDDAVFYRPAFLAANLEIQIGDIDVSHHDGAERPAQVPLLKPCGCQHAGHNRINGIFVIVCV